MARRREIEGVLVTGMSRWGRSTEYLLSTLQDLTKKNVSVIALKGSMNFDMKTPQEKLIVTFLAAISEFEGSLQR